MEDKTVELALKCFDGDGEKAEALLTLLNISTQPLCNFPKVEMSLPEDICKWKNGEECWKDIPDSCLKCKIPCEYYEPMVQ